MGLDRPIPQQYLLDLGKLLHRDLGPKRASTPDATRLRRSCGEPPWSDEEGARIEGSNGHHGVFPCADAVVHRAAPTRGACVVHEIRDGHRTAIDRTVTRLNCP